MFGASSVPVGAGARMRTSVSNQVPGTMSYAFSSQPGTSGSSSFNSWSPSIAAPPPLSVSGGGAGSVTSTAGANTPPISTTLAPSRSSTPSAIPMLGREVGQGHSMRASSPTLLRQASFLSPRQSIPQAPQVSNQMFGKPTASWPSSAPTRQISARSLGTVSQQTFPAPPIARPVGNSVQVWPQGFESTTPRGEIGTDRLVEGQLARQNGTQRPMSVQRASSIERPSLMGSRDGSPERMVLPASWRHEGTEAAKALAAPTYVTVQSSVSLPGDTSTDEGALVQTHQVEEATVEIHEQPRKGAKAAVSLRKPAFGSSASREGPPSVTAPFAAPKASPSCSRLGKTVAKETASSRQRVLSPRGKRMARQSMGANTSASEEANANNRSMLSPREDRMPIHQSSSQADLRAEGQQSPRGVEKEEMRVMGALRRELEDAKHENSRLQDKLCKARNQITLLQRQADEARAERDREHRRAEGLQLSAQQLQRQLRKECAKASLLERSLSEQVKRAEFSARDNSGAQETREELPVLSSRIESALSSRVESTVSSRVESEPEIVSMSNGRVAETKAPEIVEECVLPSVLQDSETPPVLEKTWEFVVQGQHDPIEQPDFAAKLVSCFPDDAVERAWNRGVACICSRGRRLDSTVPNQDDFLIARHTLAHDGHIALYGVFDGHGPAGHHCAAFARGSLPESLFGQHTLLMKPEDTLRDAFRHTQANLLQQPFDTESSGTTAALALVLNIPSPASVAEAQEEQGRQCETWLFVAHVGDSRVLLASHLNEETTSFAVTPLTRDHRPDDTEEAERICRDGGEVRKMNRSSGSVRVFAPGEDRPALALTRSLGISAASDCGVTSVPEVSAYRLRPGVDVLLLLGTDGLFEFCNPQDAVNKLIRENSVSVLDEICTFSRDQWAQSSYNHTVDDITAIAVSLPSNIG